MQRQNTINGLRSAKTTNVSTPTLSEDATLTHSDITLNPKGFTVSIIVPQSSCSSCLEYEAPNINELYKKHPEQVRVYILGQNARLLSPYGFEYSARAIDPRNRVFDSEFDFMNPVAVVTGPEGTIHNFYAAEVGNIEKSNRFYARMDRFLNAVQ